MPPASAVKSADGQTLGACVDGWCVVFARSGELKEASWTLPQPARCLLITDLAPGAEYRVEWQAGAVRLSPGPGGRKASSQGTLFVESE